MTVASQYGLLAFGLYAAALIGVGLWAREQAKRQDDSNFLLADRNLNFWVGAISANASDMSAWLFLGLPFVLYTQGGIRLWTPIGLLIFMFLSWRLVAAPLRRQTGAYGVSTLSSYLGARLRDSSGILRATGAILTLFFLTPYVGAGLIAVGRYCETLLGLPYHTGCVLGAALVIAYTTAGGLAAVAWVDFVQGMFLLVVIALVPWLAYQALPPDQTIAAAARAKGVSLALLPDWRGATLLQAASLCLGWGVGYFGQPHILDKFMAMRDPDKMRASTLISTAWQLLALGSSAACGLVALAFVQPPPQDPQLVFVDMVQRLFSPMMAAGVLCAVLAATLSSMDSQILVLASVIAHDLAPRLLGGTPKPKQMLWIARGGIVVMSLTALAIAWSESQTIYNLVEFCWMGLGCAFGPVVLLCLYSCFITAPGALAAMLTGGAIGACWSVFDLPLSAPLPGFTAAVVVAYGVSLFDRYRDSRD
ncbi:MAG: sodium/proline symporter [Myxococcota bacterium]